MPTTAEQATSVRTCTLHIVGTAPYSGNAEIDRKNPKRDDETHDQHERRVWRERMNSDAHGNVVIPGMGVVKCLIAGAKFLGLKIPGEGKKTYAVLMKQCILADSDAETGRPIADPEEEWLFVPGDGRAGGGSRVWKCFPRLPDWEATISLTVIGDKLTEDVVAKIAEAAGRFVGLGRFRPEKGGFYGRFAVKNIEWSNVL